MLQWIIWSQDVHPSARKSEQTVQILAMAAVQKGLGTGNCPPGHMYQCFRKRKLHQSVTVAKQRAWDAGAKLPAAYDGSTEWHCGHLSQLTRKFHTFGLIL